MIDPRVKMIQDRQKVELTLRDRDNSMKVVERLLDILVSLDKDLAKMKLPEVRK